MSKCVYELAKLRLARAAQAMYVQRNIEARSYNHCCSGKAMSVAYSECAFFSLRCTASNSHVPNCRPWPARLYNISPHYLINGTIFGKLY